MDKPLHKSNDSSVSTTGTIGSPNFSDTLEKDLYMNLNYGENSESSSQAKETAHDYHKIHSKIFENASKANRPPPSKILPSSIPLPGKYDMKAKPDVKLKDKSLLEMGFNTNEIHDWEEIVQPPKENLYKLLKNMIDNHIKPNVQIRIGGVTFNCHMMVLQCYSDFFMECSNEVLIQLPEEKITPGAFMMVYDWMLAEEPLVQREGILELFNAANFLRIKNLVNQCWLCLDDDVRFREDTAFLLYMEARNYGLESLEQLMLTRICKFFLTLVSSREFLELNTKEVCTLLSSNTIGVNSEIEIFMSVVRWVSHNWEEREQDMLEVIKCVRFSLMPPWFLVTLNKNIDCVEIDRIVSHSEVKRMINDGISYTTTQLYYGDNRDEFLHFLERYQLVAPVQRQWVFDKECSYHHRIECPNMQYVTYKSFLEYLEMIQSIGKDYWRSLEMAKGIEKSMQCCVRADCRKLNQQNLAVTNFRDQGVQVENNNRQSRNNAKVTSSAKTYSKATSSQKYVSASLAMSQTQNDSHCCPYHNASKMQQINTSWQDDPSHDGQQPPQLRRRGGSEYETSCLMHTNDLHNLVATDGSPMNLLLHDTNNTASHGRHVHTRASQTQTDFTEEPFKSEMHIKEVDSTKEVPIEKLQKAKIATVEEQELNRLLLNHKRRKILIFGGIDPYCSHCQHDKLPMAELKKQRERYRHQHKNATKAGGSDADKVIFEEKGCSGKEVVNYGDRVLYYDDGATLLWKHLCYIPFGSRHHHATVVCNGLIYLIGGTKTALGCTKKSIFEKSVWSFDPRTFKWSFECNLPEMRRDFAAIACDEMITCEHVHGKKKRRVSGFYVIGGEGVNGTPLNTVFYYNIERKQWKKKASLNVGRYGLAAVMVNNEIWIAGGIVASRTANTVDGMARCTDDAVANAAASEGVDGGGGDSCMKDAKTATSDIITDTMEHYRLRYAHCVECDGAAPGQSDATAESGSIGQWIKSKLHLRTPRLFGRFCKLTENELFLVGGIGFNVECELTSLSAVDQFDFEEKKWQHYGDFKWARHGHDIAALNDRIIIIGGVSTIKKCTLTQVESFCIKTRKSFKDMPELPWPLSGSSVVTLD